MTCFQYQNSSRTGNIKLERPLAQEGVGTYLSYLDTPVKQQLWTNVILVFMDVIQQAAVGHKLCHQLNGGAQTHPQ